MTTYAAFLLLKTLGKLSIFAADSSSDGPLQKAICISQANALGQRGAGQVHFARFLGRVAESFSFWQNPVWHEWLFLYLLSLFNASSVIGVFK